MNYLQLTSPPLWVENRIYFRGILPSPEWFLRTHDADVEKAVLQLMKMGYYVATIKLVIFKNRHECGRDFYELTTKVCPP